MVFGIQRACTWQARRLQVRGRQITSTRILDYTIRQVKTQTLSTGFPQPFIPLALVKPLITPNHFSDLPRFVPAWLADGISAQSSHVLGEALSRPLGIPFPPSESRRSISEHASQTNHREPTVAHVFGIAGTCQYSIVIGGERGPRWKRWSPDSAKRMAAKTSFPAS